MGIGDYIWPFEKKFSQIPCAREAAITGLLGGPCIGAITLIFRAKPPTIMKVTLYSGLGLFWTGFGMCRYNYARIKKASGNFTEAIVSGKLD